MGAQGRRPGLSLQEELSELSEDVWGGGVGTSLLGVDCEPEDRCGQRADEGWPLNVWLCGWKIPYTERAHVEKS